MTDQRKWLGGAMLGAGLMYLLDPRQGRRRRAQMRDRMVHALHEVNDAADTTARDLRNRSVGAAAEVKSRLHGERVTDEVLEARVRSAIGRAVTHPGAIEVSADDGFVTLRGPVLAREVDDLLSAAESVRGVRGLNHRLEVHETAGNVPGLQGEPTRRTGRRPELLQENWAPAPRLLAGAAGAGLLLSGLRRGGITGTVLGAAGASLLARAATNLGLRRLVGVNAGRRAVDIQKTITIDAPIEDVFAFWSRPENFPRFMAHLQEVRRTGEGTYHWVARGPLGATVEWDAVVTKSVPGEVLAWKSVPGSVVGNAGIARFERSPDGGTRVSIQMTYNPPAGAVGHVVASLLGVDPKRAMDEDLVRLKSLLEEGRTSARGESVTREEVEPSQPAVRGVRPA
ncbi:MAG TPA: SRPBCC family protein [Longimicrobiales bacterium]